MKLRLKGNSLRLRLGRSEVSHLASGGVLEESTAFGPSPHHRFVYRLSTSATERGASAELSDRILQIRVSPDVARRWAASDELGISAVQPAGEGSSLRILIEKDLECLDPAAGESQEDAFPHPQTGTSCARSE